MYRLVITLTAPQLPALASSAYQVFAPGAARPFAFAACLWSDADGTRAEAEGRAAAVRHAEGPVEVEVVRELVEPSGDGAAGLAALTTLTDDLDALQAAVRAAYPGELTCHRGCDSCCHQTVGVSRVEAARVAATVAALSSEARAALVETATRAAALDRPRCGALDDTGGCQIYGGRPAVCRSHGLVYSTPHLTRGRSLSVLQPSCGLNFNGAMAEAPLVYDLVTWSERLLAIDDAFADEVGIGAAATVGRSIPLADVLASLLLR